MRIKILQWNIWYEEKPENIVKTVQEIKPDIFCLQELATRYHERSISICSIEEI